jgi:hypothetical protein
MNIEIHDTSLEARIQKYPGTGSPGHQTPDAREPTFSFILGSLAYDRRLRSDSYDPQRPSGLQCGGCGGRSTAPLHSRSVRGDELNYRSSTQAFGSTTKLQHIPFVYCEHSAASAHAGRHAADRRCAASSPASRSVFVELQRRAWTRSSGRSGRHETTSR